MSKSKPYLMYKTTKYFEASKMIIPRSRWQIEIWNVVDSRCIYSNFFYMQILLYFAWPKSNILLFLIICWKNMLNCLSVERNKCAANNAILFFLFSFFYLQWIPCVTTALTLIRKIKTNLKSGKFNIVAESDLSSSVLLYF